jgi:dsDNA-binding SOS-regulon protein
MAVTTVYIITRGDKEVMRSDDKKYADWYDKRLDCADELSELLKREKDLFKDIKPELIEEICINLSMNSNKVNKILKGKTLDKVLDEDGDDEYTGKLKK